MGLSTLIAVLLVFALLAWRILSGDRSWLVGLLGAVAAIGIAMPVAVYVMHYRNSVGKLRSLQSPEGELEVDDDSITISSDQGTATLKWEAIVELWRYDSFWLLLFSKAQFVTLPLECIPDEMQGFVLERVRTSGGKIAA